MDETNEKINELVDEQVQQENWQDRLVAEYNFVKERQMKLGMVLEAYMDGSMEFELNCPAELLFAQYHSMSSYLAILELRAAIEGIGAQPEVTD